MPFEMKQETPEPIILYFDNPHPSNNDVSQRMERDQPRYATTIDARNGHEQISRGPTAYSAKKTIARTRLTAQEPRVPRKQRAERRQQQQQWQMGQQPEPEVRLEKTALAKPEHYDGNKKKFCGFMESLELHFGANTQYFRSDENKIIFALSYMTLEVVAAPRTKWVERRKAAEERSDIGETTLLESWMYFKNTLKEHFKDSHEEE
ncbi:hypothetical protein SERLADRAFT_440825 [Serpula lacrymans var. lacrymans S7.9]|uniref:DUF4939 domain-containing protein n=1 Tax=Serpula lacrymans var. lacrymans (strain S7.9) TaxID=578457 RepID=F8P4N0_SERL9|nr:uncharacterized protein SERLADRAFT_440825 [Serpula lacrymans var. lacrymans S7.9]EGO21567.1 hypothetical protein SERLADRAFT_440825 [Serpula lacrymans var. lacrymans S7.9]